MIPVLYDAKPATVHQLSIPKDRDAGVFGVYVVKVEEPMRPYALIFRPVDLSPTEEARLTENLGLIVGARERWEFLCFPAKDAALHR